MKNYSYFQILSNSNQQIIDYENMVLSTLGLLFKSEEIFSRFSFIYLGFCLNVEQPYMIITKTSQTLSSKSKIKEF